MDVPKNMYTVGELSKLLRVSADTLRYYDDIGLLSPEYISDETRYRYYTPAQATEFARIAELKSYGFPLKAIRKLLWQDTGALVQAYQDRHAELLHEAHKLQQAAEELAAKIQNLQSNQQPNKEESE